MNTVSRRDFARLVALTGSAAMMPKLEGFTLPTLPSTPLPRTPLAPTEEFWNDVRSRFLLPADLGFVNAANLCPTSMPVVEALEKNTRFLDADPSSASRTKLRQGREESRRLVAAMLKVTPEEVVITRNTSEANNFVSSGLQLGPGDEVVVFGDNHPSNLNAWRAKATRFGFSVVEVPAVIPHPGHQHYIDAFTKAMTPRTKVLAITHVTNTFGDMLPVTELCKVARSRGILAHVDGAQTFGVLDVDLVAMGADFYSGSVHKWPCGPKEQGLLYIRRDIQDRISASVVSLYGGEVGVSQRMEAYGQRDEAGLATLAAAVKFQDEIGRPAIEKRVRELSLRLTTELKKIPGVTFHTDTDPTRSLAIFVLKPANLNPGRLVATLYEKDRIAMATAGGQARPSIRVSPHFYNTMEEMDRIAAAIRRYVSAGLPA